MANSFQNPYAGIAQGAKYGTTGNGFMDAIRPALGFVNGAYQAYAANPRAGGTLIPGLAGLAEALAGRQYMRQANAWAQQEANRQNAQYSGQQQANTDAYGNAYGGAEIPANAGDAIREGKQVPNTNAMLQGKPLQIAPHGKIDPGVLTNYMNQMQEAAQGLGTLSQINTPQAPPSLQEATPQPYTDPTSKATMEPVIAQALKAGVQAQAPIPAVDYSQQSPLSMMVPKPSDLITSENNRGTLAATVANNNADNLRETQKFQFEKQKFGQQMQVAREKLRLYAKDIGSRSHNISMPQLIYNAYKAGKLTDEEYKNAITKPGIMMLMGGMGAGPTPGPDMSGDSGVGM